MTMNEEASDPRAPLFSRSHISFAMIPYERDQAVKSCQKKRFIGFMRSEKSNDELLVNGLTRKSFPSKIIRINIEYR